VRKGMSAPKENGANKNIAAMSARRSDVFMSFSPR
jgi:hypothetical protein